MHVLDARHHHTNFLQAQQQQQHQQHDSAHKIWNTDKKIVDWLTDVSKKSCSIAT
jgi:hypothetical protein